MSWLEKLYRTYENNIQTTESKNEKSITLLPVGHTIQNTHVTIVLDAHGQFLRAEVVPREETATIIPATEEAAGRAGIKPKPFPLSDKLQYIARDYPNHGGEVTRGYRDDPEEPYHLFVQQLKSWTSSEWSDPKLISILIYVETGNPVTDLLHEKILVRDETGQIYLNNRSPKTNFESIVVRWRVEIPGDNCPNLWENQLIWESWLNYLSEQLVEKGLCFVTGKETQLATNHPKKIRHNADNAKLISSNDIQNFTFRGRFITAKEAIGVSYEVSQKAHNALRWLIGRQGYRDDNRVFVAWDVSGNCVPSPFTDSQDILGKYLVDMSSRIEGNTAPDIGNKLSKKIAGYTVELNLPDDIVIIGLDAAVPGRMAVTFYRELPGSEFLDRLESWHDPDTGCTWWQDMGKEKRFFGAPSPRSIAEVAYGIGKEARKLTESEKKLRSATVERLLPCITDGVSLPRDVVESCVRRASHRLGSQHGSDESKRHYWQWEKALGVACALFRYYHNERKYAMSLEKDRKTRDYLYGRLLALAEGLEESAMILSDEKRETNAARLMQRFADRPYTTWITIEKQLAPYIQRLKARRPGLLTIYKREMDEVYDFFEHDDYCSDKPLSGEFLLGFHCQRAARYQSKSGKNGNEVPNNEESNEEDI